MFQALRYLDWTTCIGVTRAVNHQRLPGLAAEIAYNAMLSLFPAILSLLTAVGTFDLSGGTLYDFARRFTPLVPVAVVDVIRAFVQLEHPQGRVLQISFAVALWMSSSAIASSMVALDRIQNTPPRLRRSFWHRRAMAMVLTLGTIVLYISSAFLVFFANGLITLLAQHAGFVKTILLGLWWWLNWPIALTLVTLAFACLYRFGPSRPDRHQPIFLGAFLGAWVWLGLSFLFRHYLWNFSNYAQIYGALATAVILMLWLNLCALVMLIGYQLNVTVGQRMDPQGQPNPTTPKPGRV